MKNGILTWRGITFGGALLCLFGLFGPVFDLWGTPSYVWALRAGALLVAVGIGTGIVLAATGRLKPNPPARRVMPRADDDDGHRRPTSRMAASDIAAFAGPTVNVDGTPMLDGMVDVMGKSYGDSGTSFSHDFGSGISDGSFSSGTDSSSIGGSSW